ncbi:hypothetical protein GKO48_04445 [Candidatus Lucifugimonas marina]|nr:hypothetical protein GKO48_04445 [SAR202 cluster bacterium JH1073]
MGIRKKDRSAERGLFVLEFAVAVGFMGILGSLVITMLAQGWEINSRNRAIMDVAVGTSTSSTWLVRDIHLATATDLPDGGGAQATAQFTWTDGGGAHVCDFALVSGEFSRTCDATTISIARSIANLSFERTGELITVSYDVISAERGDISDSVELNVALGAG